MDCLKRDFQVACPIGQVSQISGAAGHLYHIALSALHGSCRLIIPCNLCPGGVSHRGRGVPNTMPARDIKGCKKQVGSVATHWEGCWVGLEKHTCLIRTVCVQVALHPGPHRVPRCLDQQPEDEAVEEQQEQYDPWEAVEVAGTAARAPVAREVIPWLERMVLTLFTDVCCTNSRRL